MGSPDFSASPMPWDLVLSSKRHPVLTTVPHLSTTSGCYSLPQVAVGRWHDLQLCLLWFDNPSSTQLDPPHTAFRFRSITLQSIRSSFPRSYAKRPGNTPCKCRWVHSPKEWIRPIKGDGKTLADISSPFQQIVWKSSGPTRPAWKTSCVMERLTTVPYKAVDSSVTLRFVYVCLPVPASLSFILHSSCPGIVALYKALACSVISGSTFKETWNWNKQTNNHTNK